MKLSFIITDLNLSSIELWISFVFVFFDFSRQGHLNHLTDCTTIHYYSNQWLITVNYVNHCKPLCLAVLADSVLAASSTLLSTEQVFSVKSRRKALDRFVWLRVVGTKQSDLKLRLASLTKKRLANDIHHSSLTVRDHFVYPEFVFCSLTAATAAALFPAAISYGSMYREGCQSNRRSLRAHVQRQFLSFRLVYAHGNANSSRLTLKHDCYYGN
jgi:hypothetical protein